MGHFRFQTQEQKQIVLMLCTGFFMGVFLATYQVTADSLFLNRMGDQLDKAFLVAGALGIMTTGLFSMLSKLVEVYQPSAGFRSAYFPLYAKRVLADPLWQIHAYQDQFIFALYCMTGPITAVLLLSFWGSVWQAI